MATEAVGSQLTERRVPWRPGRRFGDTRTRFVAVRCTPEEHASIADAAAAAGLSVGAFLRASALGDAGPRAARRPPIERRELARLIGLVGKLGSNVNQIAHGYNRDRLLPDYAELSAIRQEVAQIRAALLKALGRGD